MSKRLGAFNRAGAITKDQVVDAERIVAVDAPAAEVTGEAAPADEAEVNDVDGDGHDDDNGQFVDGNQEAASDAEDEGETAA